MMMPNGSFKLIITFFIVTAIDYRKLKTGAVQLVNVRNTHKLQTRSLLYPPTAPTRVQFIGGIGIPVEDLRFESVTSGYVLKAEYFLPETADVFHQKITPQRIHRRRKSLNKTEFYKESHEYATMFQRKEKHTFDNVTSHLFYGKEPKSNKNTFKQERDDVLNTQQKHGAFYRWLVYKAIETVLNNSALNGHICMLRSICEHAAIPLNYEGGLLAEILHIVLTPSTSRDELIRQEHKNYLRAEILGRSGDDCAKAFSRCPKSPMEIVSAVFET